MVKINARPRINPAAIADVVFAAITDCRQATLLVRMLLTSPRAASKPISPPFFQFFSHALVRLLRGASIWFAVVGVLVQNRKSKG